MANRSALAPAGGRAAHVRAGRRSACARRGRSRRHHRQGPWRVPRRQSGRQCRGTATSSSCCRPAMRRTRASAIRSSISCMGYGLGSAAYDGIIKYGEGAHRCRGQGPGIHLRRAGQHDEVRRLDVFQTPSPPAISRASSRRISSPMSTAITARWPSPPRAASQGTRWGGYGTLRIAMKYPGIFSSIYAMSACCLSSRTVNPANDTKLESMTRRRGRQGRHGREDDFRGRLRLVARSRPPALSISIWPPVRARSCKACSTSGAANAPNAMLSAIWSRPSRG